MDNKISRRTFLKTGIAVGAGIYGLSYLSAIRKRPALKKLKEHTLKPGLVVAHGNILRTIIKELDSINDEDIMNLNISTGEIYLYQFDSALKIISKKII